MGERGGGGRGEWWWVEGDWGRVSLVTVIGRFAALLVRRGLV